MDRLLMKVSNQCKCYVINFHSLEWERGRRERERKKQAVLWPGRGEEGENNKMHFLILPKYNESLGTLNCFLLIFLAFNFTHQ